MAQVLRLVTSLSHVCGIDLRKGGSRTVLGESLDLWVLLTIEEQRIGSGPGVERKVRR